MSTLTLSEIVGKARAIAGGTSKPEPTKPEKTVDGPPISGDLVMVKGVASTYILFGYDEEDGLAILRELTNKNAKPWKVSRHTLTRCGRMPGWDDTKRMDGISPIPVHRPASAILKKRDKEKEQVSSATTCRCTPRTSLHGPVSPSMSRKPGRAGSSLT